MTAKPDPNQPDLFGGSPLTKPPAASRQKKKMKPATCPPELQTHSGEVVLCEIDQGYKCQFWLVPLSAGELEDWWLSQDTFEDNPDGLWDALHEEFGEPPPPHSTHEIPGTFLDADADLWMQMEESGKHYYCMICCDSHTYLRRPDGSRIYHRGYTGEKTADV